MKAQIQDRRNTLVFKSPPTRWPEEETNKEPDIDLTAAIQKYLPIVKIIVYSMKANLPAHVDIEDLFSAGTLGLVAALQNFDATKGASMKTYVSIRAKGAILDELRKQDYLPRSARSKYRLLQKTTEDLKQQLGRNPRDKEVQAALDLDDIKYSKLKAKANPISMVCLDSEIMNDGVNLHDTIADERQYSGCDNMEKDEIFELINQKINELPDKERRILSLYYHENLRLVEIGNLFNLSEARISQILSQTVARIRDYLRKMTLS